MEQHLLRAKPNTTYTTNTDNWKTAIFYDENKDEIGKQLFKKNVAGHYQVVTPEGCEFIAISPLLMKLSKTK